MSIKNLEIKPSEAKAVEVASLPTRPTSSATYGGRGLTAQQMKAAYDAYPALIKERFNALIADLLSGSALSDIPLGDNVNLSHAPWSFNDSTLQAFVDKVVSVIDYETDDESMYTIYSFVKQFVHNVATGASLEYNKSTRQLTLTIDGEQSTVIIEVDKYEKAIQQLNEQAASLEATKFDKAGGGISGDVNIGGSVYIGKDLTVAGNSTIQEAGHLKIKDAVIITNSDGKKLAVLSGLAIRKGENDSGVDETYGIMYDFASNSVKLGLIYTDENGNYQFLAGEGQPVATRADSAELAEHGIALWDAANHRFIAKDMTDLDFTYGDVTVDYNTTDGMTINGQARFTYDGGMTKDVTMDIEVPIVAGEGIVLDKKASEEKVEVKLDTAFIDGKYVKKVTTGNKNQAYTVDTNNQQAMMLITEDAVAWALARRYTSGRLEVGIAVGDSDAMPKKQVEDGFLPKSDGIYGQTRVYTVRNDGNGSYQETVHVDSVNATEYSVAQRAPGGVLRVGTPVGVNDATPKKYVDDADATKLNLTGGTITGSLTIAQDLIVQGKTTSKDVENLAVKENLITLAKDNTAALTAPAGMMVPKYNGTESGALVFDNTGTAYVGDIVLNEDGNISFPDSDLQPLATRGALVNGNLVKWDADSLTLVDSGKKADDFVKSVAGTADAPVVYARNDKGVNDTVPLTHHYAQPWSIAQRGSRGVVKVGTPASESDATTKAYVDAQTTYTHYITITNENYDGMILLTIPAKISEPFPDLTELGNKLADIEKPIMATGYLQPKSATSGEPTATVYGITFDNAEQHIKALATYQTFTLTDQTITATTTHTNVPIQEDGYWTFTDYVE